MSDVKNYIMGAVFGEAIGDALGHPIEFKKTHRVKDLEQDNKFTDDTQMFCCIGEALLENPPHVDEEKFMVTVGKKFVEWRHNPLGGSHRAPGNNCMTAVRKLGAGVHWTKSGDPAGKGNGSAMRSGIIGAYYWKNPDYAFRIGALSAICTHNNLEPMLGAGMVAYLVAAMINHGDFAQAVGDGILLCGDFPNTIPFYPANIKYGVGFSDQNPWYAVSRFGAAYALGAAAHTSEAVTKLRDNESVVTDGAAVPAVAEAIFFNTSHAGYDTVVLDAVNNSDDTDTIGAISGTIAGARYGLEGIRHDWLTRIELADYLAGLGSRIVAASEAYVLEQKATDEMIEEINIDDIFAEAGDETDAADAGALPILPMLEDEDNSKLFDEDDE
jgi:ADP-ribosylglycohydrolase